MLISIVVSSIVCVVVPFLLGDLLLPNDSVCKRYIMGVLVSLAIAQVLFLPFIIYQHNFTPYFVAYLVLVCGLSIWAIIKGRSKHKTEIQRFFSSFNIKEHLSIWMILALMIIIMQVLRVALGQFFVYADNATYIPIINDLLETDKDAFLFFRTGEPGFKETDRKYLFTTYFPYLATICKFSGLHPAVLVQTILPIILTIVFYAMTWNYGLFLFKNKTAAWIFVFFFSVLVETVGGYDYTYANHVISGIYFGKKIVFTILLPFLLLFIAEHSNLLEDEIHLLNRIDLFRLLIIMTGICAPSLMGTGLAPIALFCMGIVLVVRKKSILPMLQMIIGMIPAVLMLLMVVRYLYFKA